MKRLLTAALLIAVPYVASANDGGIYSILPFNAKYAKETKTMEFTGQFAQALKQLLPPSMSVVTGMTPAIKGPYEKNFRALFITDAQGTGMYLQCTSAELGGQGNAMTVKELPDTRCSIQVVDSPSAELGEVSKVPVKDALQKAQDANKIK